MPSGPDDDMLPVASWFHAADRSLMRFYGSHQEGAFWCGSGNAGRNISISQNHARRRASVLADAGLLERGEDGWAYRITGLGLQYVRGEMSQDELEALNPDVDSRLEALGDPRRELLRAFSSETILDTSELRNRTEIPEGSILYHLGELVENGYLEEPNQREVRKYRGDSSSTARLWRLTEQGAAMIEEDREQEK